ncbi:MAG TPA: DUF302 domain-containing protein [Rhodocyclaceae bacterium]|nr:DUF302 domain-containing protein [Rhodocyclaceae bacterium]
MKSPLMRRLRASPFLLAAALAAAVPGAQAGDIVHRELAGADYEEVRQALVEAIENEGLVPGAVSHFGDMLHRSDATLHHGGDIYARAEIFSFCSIAVAAKLVQENPDRIVDCPLTIALYRLKGSQAVTLVFRPREESAAANDLMRRITERTAEQFR